MTTWYRYEDVVYANLYEDGPSRMVVELREYEEIKRTPKGVWLDLGFGVRRFVLLSARKRFACATKEEAKASFIARKKRQASIYRARMQRAEDAIREVAWL